MSKKPRIFISYRRSDSITMTGRIYDRLCAAFGDDFVFKDMEDIPMGADFRSVIEEEVNSSDVLLAIIGPRWTTLTNEQGERRLDDPNDYVRIEIESALQRPSMMVVPVLVEGAPMPTTQQIPDSLDMLPYRNAAVVRNDPDFNRDVEQLCDQIKKKFQVTNKPRRRLPLIIGAAVVMLLIIISAIALVWLNSAAPPENINLASLPTVEPAGVGKYIVLVAQPEPLRNPTTRDVARYVVDDLRRKMETNVPFSPIRIRQYNGVITSDEEAQTVAAANGASIIVWGNYTDEAVTLKVQVGSTAALPNSRFDRALLDRTLNVRVRLTDELTQSIAGPVLGMFITLQGLGDDFYGFTLSVGMSNLIPLADTEILDEELSTYVHRAFQVFTETPSAAVAEMDDALVIDPSNPLLYGIRSGFQFIQNQIDAARVDIQTAANLAPEQWYFPTFMGSSIHFLKQDSASAIREMSTLVTAFPQDWYPTYFRSIFYFLSGDYDHAREDVDRSLTLNPPTNWPYYVAIGLALRDGRLEDFQTLVATVKRNFPDVSLGTRMIQEAYGEALPDDFYQLFNLTNQYIFLNRYNDVIQDSNALIEAGTTYPTVYLARGAAYYCLGEWEQARDLFTQGLALDPDHVTMYLLRGAAYKQMNDLPAALADTAEVQKRSQSGLVQSYIAAGLRGEALSCDDFLVAPFVEATPAA